MQKQKSTEIKAILATTLCHSLWGFSFLASRTALDRAQVFVLLSHRFLLAFLAMNLLLLTGRVRLRLRGRRVLLLVLLGLFEPVIYFFGEQYGLLHSGTIFSGVMIAMIPIVSTVAAAPLLGEKPTLGQLVYSLLSVGGVVGIGLLGGSSGTLDWIGVGALIVAVLSAAAYTLLSRGISREYSPFARTYMMMAVGAFVFTTLALLQNRGDLSAYVQPLAETDYLLSVLFLALGCSVLCYYLSGYAISHMSVARETVFSNLTTAVTVFAGVVFLHEPFSWLSLAFCLLILLGIYGVQRTSKKEE